VRVVGALHSPNACAMASGPGSVLLSLVRMSSITSIEVHSGLVECGGGTTYASLNAALAGVGLALPNLGSISDQTIAGAIATGTHGTGLEKRALASCIVGLELVTAQGEVRWLSAAEHGVAFRACLCSLGVLGVVTRVRLQAVPAFDLSVEESPAIWSEVLRNLPERAASAPFYRLFWFPHTERVWEWRARPVPPSGQPAAATGALASLGRSLGASWDWFWDMGIGFHCLQAALRLSQLVPWLVPRINALYAFIFFRRPRRFTVRSDRGFNFNCLFKQHVSEWAIPLAALPQALEGLRGLIERGGFRAHFPIEVRFSASDDMLLSPSNGRATAWVGIIAYRPYGVDSGQHVAYFEQFEGLMRALQGRPHWAKAWGLSAAQLKELYPAADWQAFVALRRELDPQGLFLNAWAREKLCEEGEGAQ
jgi:L-gulonolactone oxidase